MRVAFCTFDGPGMISGVNTWMVRFLPGLIAAGVELRVFVRCYGEKDSWKTVNALRAVGVECACYHWKFDAADEVRDLLRLCRDHRPDIFVPNCITGAYYASRWVQAAGIPSLGVVHSDDPFYTRAVMERFTCGARSRKGWRHLFVSPPQLGTCLLFQQ